MTDKTPMEILIYTFFTLLTIYSMRGLVIVFIFLGGTAVEVLQWLI